MVVHSVRNIPLQSYHMPPKRRSRYRILYCIAIYAALLTVRAFQKGSRPQQLTLCRSLHAEELQATVSDGLAQGPYVAIRPGFEPTTLRYRKASILPMRYHAPQRISHICCYISKWIVLILQVI